MINYNLTNRTNFYNLFYENLDNFVRNENWLEEYKIFDDPLARVIIGLFKKEIPNSSNESDKSPKIYYDRLAKELRLVIDRDFTRLFVQVREILDLIDNDNVPHIIRGSSGSSIICYLMDITDIDPIYYSISLARFMHERRTDFPDIDIDFPWTMRDSIFKIVHDHWGKRVGRVSNHLHYHQPSALRQAIRETGFSGFIARDFEISEIIPDKEIRDWVFKRAKELVGQLKGYSLHCGGIVIFDQEIPEDLILKEYSIFKGTSSGVSSKALKDVGSTTNESSSNSVLTLLQGHKKENIKETEHIKENVKESNNGLQLRYNKQDIEKEKLIKIDILSNRGLGQLWDIEKKHLHEYDFSDSKTYEILARGDVIGITYSESRAMMKIFTEMKPRSVDHIAEALALVRPSASQSYQKSDYLRNFHLILETPETRLKYLIYDDDAIEYIQRVLKVNESIADTFRKAFSKNNKVKKLEFLNLLGQVNPGLSEEEKIMMHDQLNRLNSYSFCKSHAYSYARLVYALAYHKAHNPQNFWLAALNNCHSSFRRWVHFREASLAGIELVYGRGPWTFQELGEPFSESLETFSESLEKSKEKPRKPKLRPITPNPRYEPEIETYKNEEGKICERNRTISVTEGMLRWKYWIGESFYPGMYYKKANLLDLKPSIIADLLERCYDNKKNILKTMLKEKKNLKIAFFKGLIACSRYHRTDKYDKFLSGHDKITSGIGKRDGYLITFCTIGYDNGKYLDLIVDRLVEMRQEHYFEGAGIIKSDSSLCSQNLSDLSSPICIDVFWYRTGKIVDPLFRKIDQEKLIDKRKKRKKSTYDWRVFLQLDNVSDSCLEPSIGSDMDKSKNILSDSDSSDSESNESDDEDQELELRTEPNSPNESDEDEYEP